MSLFRRNGVWWYEFWFAGRRIQESSKSPSKTIARTAEQNRRRELEHGFNNFNDIVVAYDDNPAQRSIWYKGGP